MLTVFWDMKGPITIDFLEKGPEALWLECSPIVCETWVQSQVESYQRLKKWYLMPPCLTLSIIRYGSRVRGAIQGKELCPPLTLWCSSYWKGSLWVAHNYGWPTYLTKPNFSIFLSYIFSFNYFEYLYNCFIHNDLANAYLGLLRVFHVELGSLHKTLEESQRTHCEYINEDEDNSLNSLSNKNHQASSQKFRQITFFFNCKIIIFLLFIHFC